MKKKIKDESLAEAFSRAKISGQREKAALKVGLTSSIKKGERSWFWWITEDTGYLGCVAARISLHAADHGSGPSWPIPVSVTGEGPQQTPDGSWRRVGLRAPEKLFLKERANIWGICCVIVECGLCNLSLFAHLPISPT